jgi:glucose/arabinose dehydrogenase
LRWDAVRDGPGGAWVGPDGKLYAIVGDTGRRGRLQNLPTGPFTPPANDDLFGGPEPDDLHRTGVIVRLEENGRAPRDNPFWQLGRETGGEVGENLQKLFAYGIRNSFGLAFDPKSGDLWEQEITEGERLLFGRNFGTATDIHTGPDGDLYVVSLSHGNV